MPWSCPVCLPSRGASCSLGRPRLLQVHSSVTRTSSLPPALAQSRWRGALCSVWAHCPHTGQLSEVSLQAVELVRHSAQNGVVSEAEQAPLGLLPSTQDCASRAQKCRAEGVGQDRQGLWCPGRPLPQPAPEPALAHTQVPHKCCRCTQVQALPLPSPQT